MTATGPSIIRNVVISFIVTAAIAIASPTVRNAVAQTGASRVALAIVADARNRPIVDIGADDFVIQEAGRAREVLSIRPADYPVAVLFDASADASDDVDALRKAVERFIAR